MNAKLILGIVIGILFLTIIGIVMISDGEDSKNLGTESKTSSTVKSEVGPKETYMEYRKEFDSTINFDSFLNVVLKYSSQEHTKEVETFAEYDGALKDLTFNLFKNIMPSSGEIVEIKEEIDGNRAVLDVISTRENFKGEVVLVKENGVWKIDKDNWKQSG